MISPPGIGGGRNFQIRKSRSKYSIGSHVEKETSKKEKKKWELEWKDGDEYVEHKYRDIVDDEGHVIGRKRKRIIKKQVTEYVSLTKEEVREINAIFQTFDKDGSGGIEVGELKDAMKALGLNKTKAEIKEVMEKADRDGSGSIEIDEFKELMAGMIKDRKVTDELKKVFRIYDDDDNGFIEFANLRNVADAVAIEEGKEPIPDEDVRNMIEIADRKNRGTVDEEDFLHVMYLAGLIQDDKIEKQKSMAPLSQEAGIQ